MMLLKCDHCGNEDQERMLTVTRPHIVNGRIVGQVLLGYCCADCRVEHALTTLEPARMRHSSIAKPAHASTSGAD
jgi:hypothetical protein